MMFTNDKCVACNRCIRSCPVPMANDIKESNVAVNQEMCIQCGACYGTCMHAARDFKDDTIDFLNALNNRSEMRKISVLVDPAFSMNYPNEYKRVYGYLKSLGVAHIYSVSFGEDIVTWAYINYLKEYEDVSHISSLCPVIVDYIEKYQPSLISKLVPLHSPMMAEAIYLKKYREITEELVFLSPCIGKQMELNDENTGNYVKYNVTFKKLMEAIEGLYIDAQEAEEEDCNEYSVKYLKSGDLKESIYNFLGQKRVVLQVEGVEESYKFLKEYDKYQKYKNFIADIFNCQKGCLRGTAADNSIESDIETAIYEMNALMMKETIKNCYNPWNRDLSPEQRWGYFCEQFNELDIRDFRRNYKERRVNVGSPTEDETDCIFKDMGKTTEESRSVNCAGCGYDTCRDMVNAIYNGLNTKENCIYYIRSLTKMKKEEMKPHKEEHNREKLLTVRCFGNFEVFHQGKPLTFKRTKTKELFAYLVDRKGSAISTKQICAKLWEDDTDEAKNVNYLYQLLDDLRHSLREVNAEEVLSRNRGTYAVDIVRLDCDYYNYLENGKPEFFGEYMVQYSWAEEMVGMLCRRKE